MESGAQLSDQGHTWVGIAVGRAVVLRLIRIFSLTLLPEDILLLDTH